MLKRLALCILVTFFCVSIIAQNRQGGDPKLTEYWSPEPKKVTPGKTQADPPSDAIILFDGKDASKWGDTSGNPIKWKVEDGAMTVVARTGNIKTKQKFG